MPHPSSCFCPDCRGDSDSVSLVGNTANIDDQDDTLSEWHEICCHQVLKMVRQLTNTVRKANRMLPKPTSKTKNSKPASAGKAPAPTSNSSNGNYSPWLKITQLIDDGLKVGSKFKAQIKEARELPAGNASDVAIDVVLPKVGRFKGGTFSWGLSADKQQYAKLYEKFGDKLQDWHGTVTLQVEEPYKRGMNPSLQVL